MNRTFAVVAGVVLLGLLLLFSMTYTVRFDQVAIKTTFGSTNEGSVVTEPGLKFKLPVFAESVVKLDTRLQVLTLPLETVNTQDGQQVEVEAFMLWQIDTESTTGPLDFFLKFGSVADARTAIAGTFQPTVRRELARFRFDELIGAENRLAEAEAAILDAMREAAANDSMGMSPVSVGMSRILLPSKTVRAVLDRMKATREQLSESERVKGSAEAERIESEASIKSDKIKAFARQRAEEIRASGEEEAARYLEQMSVDEDFAIFLVHLKALEASLAEGATLLLHEDEAPWHLMSIGKNVDARGLPQPGNAETSSTSADAETSEDDETLEVAGGADDS